MIRLLFCALLSFSFHFLLAEEIRYNVALHQGNIREKPFELYKGTVVRMGKPNAEGYCQVRALVYIPAEKVLYGYKIMKDCMLLNEDLEPTGRIFSEMVLYRPVSKDSLHWKIELDGWVFYGAVDPTSIPESVLEERMLQQYPQSFNNLYKYMQDFGFRLLPSQHGFNAYELQESRLDVNDMGVRLRLVYYKGELAAIIHSRPLKLRKFESIIRNDLELIFVAPMSEELKNQLKQDYYDPLL